MTCTTYVLLTLTLHPLSFNSRHTVLYGFSLAYLIAPSTFSTANIVETVQALPESVKIAAKTILAAPFAFHSFNGLRHLAWDSGKRTPSFVSSLLTSTRIASSVQSCRSAAHTSRDTPCWVRRPLARSCWCCCSFGQSIDRALAELSVSQ